MVTNFAFDSIADLISMSGHGSYVWSAYGISLAVIVLLVLLPLRRYRQLKKALVLQNAYGGDENASVNSFGQHE